MSDELSAFLTQLDDFAVGLSASQQAMLLAALQDGEDVAGFAFDPPWPGARSALSPIKIGTIQNIAIRPSSGDEISGTDLGSSRISNGDLGSGRRDI